MFLAINARHVVECREVLIQADDQLFKAAWGRFAAKYRHCFVTFMTEQEIDSIAKEIQQKKL